MPNPEKFNRDNFRVQNFINIIEQTDFDKGETHTITCRDIKNANYKRGWIYGIFRGIQRERAEMGLEPREFPEVIHETLKGARTKRLILRKKGGSKK